MTRIADIMTRSVAVVSRGETLQSAASDAGIEIAGIVALGDMATRQSAHTDETLREISTPGP